jgi:ferredoxin-type protein NapF
MMSPSRRRLFFGKRPEQAPEEDDVPPQLIAVADTCLAANGIACRSCDDACPRRVFRFKPTFGGRITPTIAVHRCNGCGDCLPICPIGALSLHTAPDRGSR